MSDLILTSLWDTGYDSARVFLNSVKASGFSGHLVMLIDNLAVGTEEWLMRSGATLYMLSRAEAADKNGSRYRAYQHFLEVHDGYERVLLTDVRDVIVQRDPFELPLGDELWLFLEAKKIGECPWNTGYVKHVYGEYVLEQLKDKTISCTGVTMGSRSKILEYLQLMVTQQETTKASGNVDQGMHNFLLWNGLMPKPFKTFETGHGPVLTLGHMQLSYDISDDGVFLNSDLTPVHIVHQYDRQLRKLELTMKAVNRYKNQ